MPCPTPTCKPQGWQVLGQLANCLNNQRYKARDRAVPSPGGREGQAGKVLSDPGLVAAEDFIKSLLWEQFSSSEPGDVLPKYAEMDGGHSSQTAGICNFKRKNPATSLAQGSWSSLSEQGHGCSPYMDEAFLGFNTHTQ